MVAYACRISEENFDAIASEKPDFDREQTLQWLEQNGTGYFLRDESTNLDCGYFVDDNFFQMYTFDSTDKQDLFRRVLKIA
jgi:hypothetical protein